MLNAVLGFVQEARADIALARLKEMAAPEAKVIRGGEERLVAASQVVPGDPGLRMSVTDGSVVLAQPTAPGLAFLQGELAI